MITIASEYKYASLQMAAEAFLIDKAGSKNFAGDMLVEALVQGNRHSSKFTQDEAENFSQHWEVVAHRDNTGTGNTLR